MEYVCNRCKSTGKTSTLKNDKLAGWKNGKITRVNNYRCPICGSNDLCFRVLMETWIDNSERHYKTT